MYIDFHVHCRDEEQRDKETIEHALSVAKDSGLDAIFDMPNTERPVTTRQRVLERFELAKKAQDLLNTDVFYGLYIGLTSNPEQIKEAVETWGEFYLKPISQVAVVGLKMFAGKSVGDLAIIEPEKQREVYAQLTKLDYDGVLAVHCEKESEMKPELWDPSKPLTHSDARPEIAEIASILDQISSVIATKYQGKLHICHVSTPESVDIVNTFRNTIQTSCGITPHHLLLSNEMMRGENGILYKVNPPLRDWITREALFDRFCKGKIDVLESDHAPHTREDKLERYMSGIPNLSSWQTFTKILENLGVEKTLMNKVTFDNISDIINRDFEMCIPRRELRDLVINDRTSDYVFDPYASLKQKK